MIKYAIQLVMKKDIFLILFLKLQSILNLLMNRQKKVADANKFLIKTLSSVRFFRRTKKCAIDNFIQMMQMI